MKWADSTKRARSRLYDELLETMTAAPEVPLQTTAAIMVQRKGVAIQTKLSYAKNLQTILRSMGEETTVISAYIAGLRVMGAEKPIKQADPITKQQLLEIECPPHVKTALLLAWKTASRMDEIARLEKDSIVESTPEMIVVNFSDRTKKSRGKPFLPENMCVVTGDLTTGALSNAERGQITGAPGPASADTIKFDPAVFPSDAPATIDVQPPASQSPANGSDPNALPADKPSLPALSTGNDAVDGEGAGVVLSAGISPEMPTMFDGLTITSSDNVIRSLELRNFENAIVVRGVGERNHIGGRDSGDGNVVVNNINGIVLRGGTVGTTEVLGNSVGVDRAGRPAGNASFGILITEGAHQSIVGATTAPNIVGGNTNGIGVTGDGTADNSVASNRVGTNAAGLIAIPNGTGIVVDDGAQGSIIGGVSGADANVISGNTGEGVWLKGETTQFTSVQSNLIGVAANGTDPLPNGGDGILVTDGADQNFLSFGNIIAFNHGAGLRLRGDRTLRNTIRRNSMYDNGGPPIVLEQGANKDLPAPILTDTGMFLAEGTAVPNSLVDLYSDAGDEGRIWEFTVRAGPDGKFRVARLFQGPNITATATDAEGNTSPFGLDVDLLPTPGPTPTPRPTPFPTLENVVGRIYLPYLNKNDVTVDILTIEPPFSSIAMGALVDLEVRAHDLSNVYGMQIVFDFDPDVLQIVDVNPDVPGVQIAQGDLPDPDRAFFAENSVDAANGKIYFTWTLLSGPGTLTTGGLYTAPTKGSGTAKIQVKTGSFSAVATVVVYATSRV